MLARKAAARLAAIAAVIAGLTLVVFTGLTSRVACRDQARPRPAAAPAVATGEVYVVRALSDEEKIRHFDEYERRR